MSYIQSTIRCNGCGIHMNVAFGIVGMTQIAGWPDKCPKCGSPDFQRVAPGWHADDNGNLRLGLTRREDRMPDQIEPSEIFARLIYETRSKPRREAMVEARDAAIRRDEREACAKIVDGSSDPFPKGARIKPDGTVATNIARAMQEGLFGGRDAIAAAIRAREPGPGGECQHRSESCERRPDGATWCVQCGQIVGYHTDPAGRPNLKGEGGE